MKKMKKLFAMLLAFAMIMGMSLTSFAAITGSSISVTNLSTEAEQTVKIYELYRLDENNNLWVLSDWAKKADILTSEADLADANKIALLADKVPATPVETKTTSTGSTSFTGLQAGAYLVIADDTANKTEYNPMVAVTYAYDSNNLLVAANATTVAKASKFNIDKVFDSDSNVVEVGDLITYTITTTVPYLAENEVKSTFKLSDTLTGATYFFDGTTDKNENGSLSVTVGTQPVDVNAFKAANNGKTSFVLDLSSYVSDKNTFAGQKVTVEYTVLVNEDVDLVNNKVYSEWAEEVNVTSYTGQVSITKYGEANVVEGDEEVTYPTLKGAEFVLYNKDGKFAVVTDGYVSGWVETEKEATKLVTGEDGVVTVKGLDLGTYSFKEVKAPKGYSINTTDESVTITVTDLSPATKMYDTKLSSLPATGGVGTAAFTIGGCAIMIAAAYFFFVSRKKES